MKKTLLLICSIGVLPLTMCQQSNPDLMPAGTLQASVPQADAMLQQAKTYMAQGKYGKAESVLERLLEQYKYAPCAAEARFALAETYEKRNMPRDAFEEYEKVVVMYPSSALYQKAIERQLSLAMAAAEGKLKVGVMGLWKSSLDSETVQKWLGSVIRNAPYNDLAATAASILGKHLVEEEEYDKAVQVYAQLVEKYPTSRYAPEAQLMVAQLWASSRTRGDQNMANLQRAQEAYEEFSLRFPRHADAGKALAEASNVRRLLVQQELEAGRFYLERSHEYTSAVFCFENVIRQRKINPTAAKEAETLLQRARAAQAATASAR